MRIGWLAVLLLAIGCGPHAVPAPVPAPEPAPIPAPIPLSSPHIVTAPTDSSPEQPILAPCSAHPQSNSPWPFLKGQVHVHTERSFDAATPVNDVITFYADRGYDFLSITDHNHITVPKEHPSGIVLIPGVELTYNATTCDPSPRPGYLCALHTSVLFLNPMRDGTKGRHFNLPFRRQRLEAFQVQILRAEDLEGLLVLNHPTYHYAVDDELLDQLVVRGVRFVEFFNGGVLDRSKDGTEAEIEQGERLWDAMLDRGHHVLAMGGDDAHHFADAATIRMTGKKPLLGDRVWLMVRSERTPEAIRKAMTDGDFYVSTGVELAQLEVSQSAIHVEVQEREGETYVTRFIGQGGHILARVEGTKACYPIVGDEGYVRAVVDSNRGTHAWTQPSMLQRL